MPSGYEHSADYGGPGPSRFGIAIGLIILGLAAVAGLGLQVLGFF